MAVISFNATVTRAPSKVGDEVVFRADERVHHRPRDGDAGLSGYVRHKVAVRGRLCAPILALAVSDRVVVIGNVEPRRNAEGQWSNYVVASHIGIQIEPEPLATAPPQRENSPT
jgi:hypothetical protein